MGNPDPTALGSVMVRAAHALHDEDPIFEDTLSLKLAGLSEHDVKAFLEANGPESLGHVARLFQCQRSRFVEEQVAVAADRGVDQFVDLGAGLSSFAWRRPDLMSRLDLFEVDQPATQDWKLERIDAAGFSCPSNLHFAAVDFASEDDLASRLKAVGFEPERPSIWSWLGVILYLPVDAIRSTLTAVRELAASGSTLIASYGVPNSLMDPDSQSFAEITRAWTSQAGTPQITWLAPDEIEALAKAAGWVRVNSVDPASLKDWFVGRTDGLEPVRYEWLLVAEA
jgi:methyltransferase (TIGR00027 family)